MSFNIAPIGNLTPPAIGPQTGAAGGAAAAPGAGSTADFGSALKDALGALDSMNGQADASTLQLATGNQVDVHEVMLNMENASLGFNFAVQVRNKLVDAYQEIMRMSV